MNDVRGKKIFVGLSGGVDSAVTARLLQKAGADVYGVFIKGWYPEDLPCTWAEDRRDAMRVAASLKIPFHTLDASKEYKESVIEYLVSEYRVGRTPNPDIMCNRDVKFGVFYEFAKKQGADYLATGHYAKASRGTLARGEDPEKDQSYFLWAISKEVLAMTLFPVGELHKSEVRNLARQFSLPNAQKRDSQGICFLGPVSMDDFLRAECPVSPGIAHTEAGEEVGTHEGALLYTLGERATLSAAMPGPWYVVGKDMDHNTITVSKDRMLDQAPATLRLSSTNWFSIPGEGEVLEAQYRYHGPRVRGTYDATTDTFIPESPLTEPIAPGQSLVLYRGDVVVGGGIIG